MFRVPTLCLRRFGSFTQHSGVTFGSEFFRVKWYGKGLIKKAVASVRVWRKRISIERERGARLERVEKDQSEKVEATDVIRCAPTSRVLQLNLQRGAISIRRWFDFIEFKTTAYRALSNPQSGNEKSSYESASWPLWSSRFPSFVFSPSLSILSLTPSLLVPLNPQPLLSLVRILPIGEIPLRTLRPSRLRENFIRQHDPLHRWDRSFRFSFRRK